MMKRVLVVVGLTLVLCGFKVQAAEGPLAAIKGTVDEVIEVLKKPEFQGHAAAKARLDKIWSIISQRFADEEMTRRVLARHWKELSPKQREEMIGLFSHLLKLSYVTKLEGYHEEEVAYQHERLDGDYAEVDSVVIHREEKIPLNYRLLLKNGRWMVYDVIIDGVSLVANYRRQFHQIILKEGYAALVERLKAKKGELEELEKTGKGEKG